MTSAERQRLLDYFKKERKLADRIVVADSLFAAGCQAREAQYREFARAASAVGPGGIERAFSLLDEADRERKRGQVAQADSEWARAMQGEIEDLADIVTREIPADIVTREIPTNDPE